eukprot:768431-Hanusia_phi.AAC.11
MASSWSNTTEQLSEDAAGRHESRAYAWRELSSFLENLFNLPRRVTHPNSSPHTLPQFRFLQEMVSKVLGPVNLSPGGSACCCGCDME